MFTVTVECNARGEKVQTSFSEYAKALGFAQGASAMASILGWTRSRACSEPIHHFAYYGDLYNEGAIVLMEVLGEEKSA